MLSTSDTAEVINIEEFRSVLLEMTAGDNDLFEKFHHIDGGESKATDYVVSQVMEANEAGAEIFANKYWYAVLLGRCLYSFAIKKEHRNDEIKKQFISFVVENCDTSFLWAKNTRAVKFLLKSGFSIEETRMYMNHKYYKLCL